MGPDTGGTGAVTQYCRAKGPDTSRGYHLLLPVVICCCCSRRTTETHQGHGITRGASTDLLKTPAQREWKDISQVIGNIITTKEIEFVIKNLLKSKSAGLESSTGEF